MEISRFATALAGVSPFEGSLIVASLGALVSQAALMLDLVLHAGKLGGELFLNPLGVRIFEEVVTLPHAAIVLGHLIVLGAAAFALRASALGNKKSRVLLAIEISAALALVGSFYDGLWHLNFGFGSEALVTLPHLILSTGMQAYSVAIFLGLADIAKITSKKLIELFYVISFIVAIESILGGVTTIITSLIVPGFSAVHSVNPLLLKVLLVTLLPGLYPLFFIGQSVVVRRPGTITHVAIGFAVLVTITTVPYPEAALFLPYYVLSVPPIALIDFLVLRRGHGVVRAALAGALMALVLPLLYVPYNVRTIIEILTGDVQLLGTLFALKYSNPSEIGTMAALASISGAVASAGIFSIRKSNR